MAVEEWLAGENRRIERLRAVLPVAEDRHAAGAYSRNRPEQPVRPVTGCGRSQAARQANRRVRSSEGAAAGTGNRNRCSAAGRQRGGRRQGRQAGRRGSSSRVHRRTRGAACE